MVQKTTKNCHPSEPTIILMDSDFAEYARAQIQKKKHNPSPIILVFRMIGLKTRMIILIILVPSTGLIIL